MINNIRSIIFNPVFLLFDYKIKRFSFFVALFLVALSLLSTNIYINNLSFSLLKQKTNVEEEISEDSTTTVIIQKGDTLGAILQREKINNEDIQKITKIAAAQNLTSLKIGNTITFEYDITLTEDEGQDLATEQKTLNMISFEIDNLNSVDVIKSENEFIVKTNTVPLTKLVTKYEAVVESNVISSLKKAGLSTNSIISLINAYSHQIDFQRQIQPDDKIIVITEKFVTPDSKFSHHGDIIYASIQTQGEEYRIYKYSPSGQKDSQEFFSYDGQSIKGTLLKTPIKVARISSHFGIREKHPVHGYSAMHNGVDFAAPVGTPIYSAGGGVVEFIGWKSGYGRMIVIKHTGGLSTAYAHASKFANNLQKGSKVKQGDTIAFVGTSGNVTGAHLHYEIRVNGKHTNPTKFKSTPSIQLKGVELAKFNKFKTGLARLESKLDGEVELAANDVKEIKLF